MKIHRIPAGANMANCYVVIDSKTREAVVIDPGGFDKDILDIIDSAEVRRVKYILLTHGHYDHILGAEQMREHTGAQIGIHPFDADCTSDEKRSLADTLGEGIQKPFSADFLFKNGMKLKFGDTELTVMHTPGHSQGSVCFLCRREHIVFTGDTLFCLTVGRTDLNGGNHDALVESVEKLMELPGDWRIFPGHNRETTLMSEKTHNRFVRRRR